MVKVRQDSAFLAVADGVNWGEAPMRAARCAINAVYEHLETNLLLGGPQALKIRNTRVGFDSPLYHFAMLCQFRAHHSDDVSNKTNLRQIFF